MRGEVARLFDAMADSYERLEPWYEHLYARVHALLRAELRPAGGARPARALDAGCGTGFQAALLEDLGWRVHGVDLAGALLARARDRLRAPALALATVETLPYRDGAFDVAACCGSTLSFVADPARALRELGRVLRPGGRLLLDAEHKWSLDLAWALVSAVTGDRLGYGVGARELLRQLRRAPDGCRVAYPGYGRLRLFTMPELRAMLRAAELDVVRVWGVHAVTNVIPSTVLHRERLPRALATVYRALCTLDDRLGGSAFGRGLANSAVLLARKGHSGLRAG
jgi:SAM-dependent methyltransferase